MPMPEKKFRISTGYKRGNIIYAQHTIYESD